MPPGDPCPLCGLGELTLADGGWLRCPACRCWFDHHGHAYDAACWQLLDWRRA